MFLRLGNICWHGNTSNTCRHPWRIQQIPGAGKLREILRVGPVGSEDRHRCFYHVFLRLPTSMLPWNGYGSGAIHPNRDWTCCVSASKIFKIIKRKSPCHRLQLILETISPFQLELRWFWRVVAAEPAIFLRLTGPAEPRGAAWKVGQDWAAVG